MDISMIWESVEGYFCVYTHLAVPPVWIHMRFDQADVESVGGFGQVAGGRRAIESTNVREKVWMVMSFEGGECLASSRYMF